MTSIQHAVSRETKHLSPGQTFHFFLAESSSSPLQTIRNRKKVTVLTDFLFSGSKRERLGRHYGRSAQAQHHRAFLRRRYWRVVQLNTANPARRQGAVRPGIAPRGAIKDNARERRGIAPIEHMSIIQLQRCPQAAAASPQDKVQGSTSNRIDPMHTIACIRLRIRVLLIAGST